MNIYWSKNEDRAVTSCFRSKTERELNAARKNNIVPGPGTYDLKLEVTTYAQLPAVKIRPFPKIFYSRWRQKDKWRCHFENIVWLCPLQQCRCHLIHLHLDQVHIKLLIIKALRKSSCLGNWSKNFKGTSESFSPYFVLTNHSAVFKSGSSRWIRQKNTNLPGPGFYDPSTPRQVSYLYSTDTKWLPA